MMIREPAVAGRFYAAGRRQCLADMDACLEQAADNTEAARAAENIQRIIGGVVPHAGWMCSGSVASQVFKRIAERHRPDAIIIFGAIHVMHGPVASLFPSGAWETPLGLVRVDDRLADRLEGQTGLLENNPHAHEREHSIEVEVPFLQLLLPETPIVPIMVPPNDKAAPLGAAIGRTCHAYGTDVVFLASTDLTHYGPSYGFTPHGVGPDGIRWASDVNDRRMIDLMLALEDSKAVEEAKAHHNACGSGAIAAMLAAAKACGGRRATLLEHTTSYDVLRQYTDEPPHDAVGYAALAID